MQSGTGGTVLPKEVSHHAQELQAVNDDVEEISRMIAQDSEAIQLLSDAMAENARKFDIARDTIRALHTKHDLAQANIGRRTDLVLRHCLHLTNDLLQFDEETNGRDEVQADVLYSIFSMKVDSIVQALDEQEAYDESQHENERKGEGDKENEYM